MRNGIRQRQINKDALTISVEQCAKVLGISKVSAYAAVKRGDLPTVRIGRRILVPRRALEAMLAVSVLDNYSKAGRRDASGAGPS